MDATLKEAIENMLAADPNNPVEVRAAQSQLRQALAYHTGDAS